MIDDIKLIVFGRRTRNAPASLTSDQRSIPRGQLDHYTEGHGVNIKDDGKSEMNAIKRLILMGSRRGGQRTILRMSLKPRT